jgi:hypothetical protein
MERRRRRSLPSLERLETRDVPSALTVHGGAATRHQAAALGPAAPPWVNLSFIRSLVPQLYGPITTTAPIQIGNNPAPSPPGTYAVPQPTPQEIRHQTFWLQFVGHYSVGTPRFSNQASTIHIFSDGRSATSNQFLNGRSQILLFPPADPTAKPTTLDPVAGQVAGIFTVFPANALQSSSSLFTQVTNFPGVASNDPSALDHGLPSRLELMIDPGGVSGGVYSTPAFSTTPPTLTNPSTGATVPLTGGSGGAVAFNRGAGMISIKYMPTNHLRAGASQSGTVIVRVQGVINGTGVTNSLYKGIN